MGAKSLQQDPRCTPSSGEIDGRTTGQNSIEEREHQDPGERVVEAQERRWIRARGAGRDGEDRRGGEASGAAGEGAGAHRAKVARRGPSLDSPGRRATLTA
ncbi:hypothetical protein ACMHYB_35020 [Sorangium sp. So ce1128]